MKQNEANASEAGSLTSLLTVAEVALVLKISRGTVYNQIHSGQLVPDSWYRGRFPRFKPETISAKMESKRRERAPRKRNAAHGA